MPEYFLICIAISLAGYGVLALLGADRALASPALAAPGIALALVVTCLVSGVSLGATLHQLTIIIMFGGILSVGFGLISLRRRQPASSEVSFLLIPLLCPIALLSPFFWWGIGSYPGSWFWDGWNYIAVGQYLLDTPLASTSFASPFYSYTAALAKERFASSATIGLIAYVFGGDGAFAGFGLFLALSVFVFTSSVAFAAIVCLRSPAYGLLTAVVASTGLWMLNIVQANNLDSLLLTSLCPLLFGLSLSAQHNDLKNAGLVGVLIASLVCAQVELLPLAMLILGAGLVQRAFHLGLPPKQWLLWCGTGAAATVILSAPWLPSAVQLFFRQWSATQVASAAARPGNGYFPGFFKLECVASSFWGFLAPLEACGAVHLASLVVAALFFALATLGACAYYRQLFAPSLAATLLTAGATLMLVRSGYDYGAYKFLSVAWFCFAMLLVAGARSAAQRVFTGRVAFLAAALVLLLPQGALLVRRLKHFDAMTPIKNVAHFLDVRQLPHAGKLALEISDPLALQWALYALRARRVTLISFNHPYLMRIGDMQVKEPLDGAHLLTDRSAYQDCMGTPRWTSGPYRLHHMPVGNWVLLSAISNPNGIENWGFWIGGPADTRISVVAREEATLLLSADTAAGPSLPATKERTLLVTSGLEHKQFTVLDGQQAIAIRVPAGSSHVTLRVLDSPTVHHQPNGDTRPLLLAVRRFAVCPQ